MFEYVTGAQQLKTRSGRGGGLITGSCFSEHQRRSWVSRLETAGACRALGGAGMGDRLEIGTLGGHVLTETGSRCS